MALLDMLDGRDVDQKILAVPVRDPRYESITALDDLEQHTRREIEHFFLIYKELEGRMMHMRGWGEADQARRVISESRSRYLTREQPGKATVSAGHR